MKIARLYLKAFGPFDDRVLDLEGADFHIVYGPNEAGKSTTLRAVISFFFGIPERTADAFLHDYPALRVGAALCLPDGKRLCAMRRKARKHTLFRLDEANRAELTDRPLPENAMETVLGGLDEPLYRSLFGLDLKGLENGGEALLRGEGEVGQSLFQAAAGLAGLRQLMGGLEEEAAALFKPKGSTGKLNIALRAFDEQKKRLREATVRTYVWENAERALREAEKKHEDLRAALKARRAEQQRLGRIRANLPLAAERRAKRAELEQYKAIPLLPAEAPQRRATAQERLRGARETQQQARAELERLDALLAAINVDQALLDQARAIEQLYHATANYRQAREALPRLEAQRQTQRQTMGGLLAAIDPGCPLEQAASLVPAATLAARVQALIETHARLTGQDEQLESQQLAKQASLDRLDARLSALPMPGPLEELEAPLAAVAGFGDLEGRRRGLDQEMADLEATLARAAGELGADSAAELVTLRVPLSTTVEEFDAQFAELSRHEHLLDDQEATIQRDLQARRGELRTLTAAGEIATQPQVQAARARRDEGWSCVRRGYIERSADPALLGQAFDAARPLPEAFEAALGEADRLADLLHADAQRATTYENTRQRIREMESALTGLAGKREDRKAHRDRLEADWAALIAPLRRPELTPAAARQWLAAHALLVADDGRFEGLNRERQRLDADLATARVLLDQALSRCALAPCAEDEPLAASLSRARGAVEAARKTRADRQAIEGQIEGVKTDLETLDRQRQGIGGKLLQWREDWIEAVKRLRLPADALPAEARARLEQLTRLADALEGLETTERDGAGYRETLRRFESRVEALAGSVTEAPDEVAADRYDALGETREQEAQYRRLAADQEGERRRLTQAQACEQEALDRLAELLTEAGCDCTEALPEIEAKAARKRALQQRLAELDAQLVQQSARPLDEVLKEIEGQEIDAVTARLEELNGEIRDLDDQAEAAQGQRFLARQQFEAIDGAAAAAEVQQTVAELSARIASEVRAYARARLASAVLGRVVKAYQERYQGPVLGRASAIFARITLESFPGLTTDYEEDRQVLLGIRSDGARVPVSGMSEGTRHQLFLALRLAAIEQHLDSRGPIPVVIDDLLVQFDDERARATLAVLSALAQKTQLLFFTHHAHLLELARETLPAGAYREHRLLHLSTPYTS